MTVALNPFCSSSAPLRRLYIFGAGGFGREVAWLTEQIFGNTVEVIFLVDHPQFIQEGINGSAMQLLAESRPSQDSRFVAAIGDPALRRKAASACSSKGLLPTTLIHPRAEMSKWMEIGQGTVICAGAILTSNISIGTHVQVNLACTVGHDVSIGDFSTLSPGVHVSGHVQIGREVFIGTGACIINGSVEAPLTIGDGAIIAAGACVTRPVDAGALVAGVPAIRKR